MLYNTPNTPVLIKKIALKIWKIRSEIEAIIRNSVTEDKQIDLKNLQEKYEKITSSSNVVDGVVSPSGETEEISISAEANLDTSDSAMNDIEKDSSGMIVIKQLRPDIPENDLINASMLLSEIYMDTVFFFTEKNLLEGQIIAMEFLVPKKFILKAEIIYCRPYSRASRIIGKNRLPYRAYAKLILSEEGSRSMLREFLQSIAIDTSLLDANKEKNNEDDDFSELNNL